MMFHILGDTQSQMWVGEGKDKDTHLWIQLVDAAHGLFNSPVFDRLSNLHPLLNCVLVDVNRDARLTGKLDGSLRHAFGHKIIE